MRWLFLPLGFLLLIGCLAIKFSGLGGIRSTSTQQRGFGTLYYDSDCRGVLSSDRFCARFSDAKQSVEAALGAFNKPLFVWVSSVPLSDLQVDAEGGAKLVSYDGEVEYSPGSKNTLIKVTVGQADQFYLSGLLARARVLEIQGRAGHLRNPDDIVPNGIGLYLCDPTAKKVALILKTRNYDRDGLVSEEDRNWWTQRRLLGWLSCAYLQRVRGWDVQKIARSSDSELNEALKRVPRDGRSNQTRSPFDSDAYSREYWMEDVWREVSQTLPK